MRVSLRVLEGWVGGWVGEGGLWRERRLNRRLLTDMTSERQAGGAEGSGVGERGEEGANGLESACKVQRAGKRSSVSMRQSAILLPHRRSHARNHLVGDDSTCDDYLGDAPVGGK